MAAYLKGSDVAWNFEAVSWEELQKRPDLLGEPRIGVKSDTPEKYVVHKIYEDVGLIVVEVNGRPVEFHLYPVKPTWFLPLKERLGLKNPNPLMIEFLQVLESPPMEAPFQWQAVETRIRWETFIPGISP